MMALDTNILVALWDPRSGMTIAVSRAYQRYRKFGPIVICGPVFSELLGFPQRTSTEIHHLLNASEIRIEWEFSEADWLAAGHAYQGYVNRRKSSGGGLSRRMLTDFLIGAHASVRGYSLVTMDQDIYRAAFPNLHIESL